MRLLRPSGNDIEAKIELEAIDEEPRQLAMKTMDASFSGPPRAIHVALHHTRPPKAFGGLKSDGANRREVTPQKDYLRSPRRFHFTSPLQDLPFRARRDVRAEETSNADRER